ncbi:MAG TPA: aspartyl protease family protein [Candidatus Polarisedimenticolia bacterium]|nr:aspartyl protease family protein [Candidatus Polarisedimenticolia bacterium]
MKDLLRLRSLSLAAALLAAVAALGWLYRDGERLPSASAAAREAAAGHDEPLPRRAQRDRQVDLARSLVQENDYAGAVAALDRALEAIPGDAEALALQVRAFRAQRRYVAARAASRRILGAYPESPLAYILLGSVAMQQGDSVTARRELERAVEMDDRSAQALAQLAALDLMQGKIEDARLRGERALALEPDNATALRIMSRVERSVPRLIALYRKLLGVSPEDALAKSWIGILERSAAPEVNYVAPLAGEARVPLELDADGRFYVRADLPGRRGLRLLLDTGASGMVLSETVARSMGMKLQEFSESAGLGGLTRHSHPILLRRIEVGGVRARELMATASNLPPGVDGILNPTIFAPPGSGVVVELHPSRHRLMFRREPASSPAQGSGWVSIPYLADGYHIIFRVVLAGQAAMALLDTGAAVELIDRSVLRRLPGAVILSSHEAGTSLIGFGGQIDDAETVDAVPLRIAGRNMVSRRLFLVDLNEESFRFQVDLDAIVGIARLREFDLRIDPGAGRLAFRPLQ